MVDFKRLRSASGRPEIIHPVEIFRRLPKPPGINDLYTSQAEALNSWFSKRETRDIVLKLHTGGGKTLVGLLIAQSTMNEKKEPVIYLCPNNQLVEQTLSKASDYNIAAVPYVKGEDFADDFYDAKAVMVCNYSALFNGKSRFGLKGDPDAFKAGAVILDDAHVAFSTVRDQFSIRFEREDDEESYSEFANIFRGDFDKLGRLGTFDAVVASGERGFSESSILEVPYWSWNARKNEVRSYLQSKVQKFPLRWPFLRDSIEYCLCLVSRKSIVVTPILPLVDLIPAFAECPRRIYMSATIGDDSAIIQTFDASTDSVASPILSESLAGVSERMILAPETMSLDCDIVALLKELATTVTTAFGGGALILVRSSWETEKWLPEAQYPDTTEKVREAIEKLQDGSAKGPFVLANRYDGIDLPGTACHLLIMDGKPSGMNEYDLYRAAVFLGGQSVDSELAQRVEQGLGRGARGSSDYCVVIITGKDLVGWISRSTNQKFLTNSTRAQLEIGLEVTKDVRDKDDFIDTVRKCLRRDRDWVEYHAERLAELTAKPSVDSKRLATAGVERKALSLFRSGYYDKAINVLVKHCESEIDAKMKGWLTQFAARIAEAWGDTELSQNLQQQAYALNNNVLKPRTLPRYVPLSTPGNQAKAIVERIPYYRIRFGYVAEFEEAVSHLNGTASSNQFEQSLAELGTFLGFKTERPDKETNEGLGPDVLWLVLENKAFIIEAKSRKNEDNSLTKDQHGQLLNAVEWFRKNYPTYEFVRIAVHPNILTSRSVETNETMVLTLSKLNQMVDEAKALLVALCETFLSGPELEHQCQRLLEKSNLTPNGIEKTFLSAFKKVVSATPSQKG